MIMMTRRVGEAVLIGGTRVEVQDVQGKGRVVLAIDPEPGVNVVREKDRHKFDADRETSRTRA
jgi:sRNA-binding carbon storage regulator CsrA